MSDSGPWLQATFEVPEALSDPVSAFLCDLGSSGQELREGSRPGIVKVLAYFGPGADRDTVDNGLRTTLAELTCTEQGPSGEKDLAFLVESVPMEDWSLGWRAHFRPIRIADRICVCPPWEVLPDPPDGFTLVIEPKMAFGTGHHETTRLALRRMVSEVGAHDRVLDVGCGSGILSIAAARLGSLAVTGVDTDHEAVANANENVLLNGVADQVRIIGGSARDVPGEYDLVVANIISSALVPILPDIASRLRPGGRALLGGLLVRESPQFRDSAGASGLCVVEEQTEGEWAAFVATR
jgi:ribosomal protein L11 methyltransferase